MISYYQILIVVLILITGCSGSDEPEISSEGGNIPEHIKELDNLKVYSTDTQEYDTVLFEMEQVFESNEEVFIKGYIGEFAIDSRDNMYIAGSSPGEAGIYVFDPDGDYLTTFGRFGRGPGEFESIGSIDVREERLFVFDPRMQKFSVFSLEDFSLLNDKVIRRNKVRNVDTLAYMLRGNKLHATGDETFLLKQSNLALSREKDIPKVLYSRISSEGDLIPGRILELKRFPFYFFGSERGPDGSINMPRTMPFSARSLVAVGENDRLYTAWAEDFLVKVFDTEGGYQQAIYYPYDKSSLSLSEIEFNEPEIDVISENRNQVPETWPALHAMEIDDQDRLWVFSITDSDSTYQGWVLKEDGELEAKFSWPGIRSERHIMSEPVIKIKNGYLYTHERDINAGVDRILKYRIDMD